MRPNEHARTSRGERAGRTILTLSVLAFGWLAMSTSAHAGDAKLPDAATLLDKYVEVTGGKAAYAKLHNCVATKRVVHVGMGFEDTMTEYRARPNMVASVIESEAVGNVRSGADGKVSWYLSEGTGALVDQGEPLAANLDAAAFDQIDQWRKYYKDAKCVAEETVDGKACYKVVLTPNHGPKQTRFYDKKTNLVVKGTKTRLSSHMPTREAQLTISDYKWVDGILLPHKYAQAFDMCGSKREMVFVTDSIKFNVDFSTNKFELPEEIVEAVKNGTPEVATRPAPCGVSGKSGTGKVAKD